MQLKRSKGGRILALFAATALFIGNAGVWLPLYVFFSNGQEFSTPLFVTFSGLLGLSLIVSLLATLCLASLPESWGESLIALLVGLTFITYVQAYLLVGNYGALDGSDIELSDFLAFSSFEVPFWLGIPIVALWRRRWLVDNQFFLSLLLVGIPFVGVVAV
jgi:hypothetical protein